MIWDQIKTAVIRTLVPVVVAIIGTALARLGIHLDDGTLEFVVTGAIGGLLGVAYHIVVSILERIRSSRWGWLLGSPNAPQYNKAPNTSVR